MLQHLEIHNFAIIDQLHIDFEEGMTVLTGETGAGKSIIIDAIGQLMGGRGSSDFIRYETEKYLLKGLFFVPHLSAEGQTFLSENGIDFSDNQLLITRELNQSGKNTIKVNGSPLTVSLLKKLGQFIVDIHGQNEHQALMDTKRHIRLVDSFGVDQYSDIYQKYKEAFVGYREAKEALEKTALNEQETAQRIDLLTYQVSEIDESAIKIGEEEELITERDQMRNYQKIVDALQNATALLMDQDWNVVDLFGQVVGDLNSISDVDEDYANYAEQANSAYYAVQDLASSLRTTQENLYYDPIRLDEIESRLQLYSNLKRKYGNSAEKIIAYGERAQKELDKLTHMESYQSELEAELKSKEEIVLNAGKNLHEARLQVSEYLAKRINQELQDLYMQNAEFKIEIKPSQHILVTGLDNVEFYIRTNLGEPFKPLVKTASGGELSRIMLAMKTVFQTNQNITAIIFDEVDTGVSGRVAQAIANKMYKIGVKAQVLCISHLPQVAAMADNHLHIQKQEEDQRTITTVTTLSPDQRVVEVAQMTTGETVSDSSKAAAEDLLNQAEDYKAQI